MEKRSIDERNSRIEDEEEKEAVLITQSYKVEKIPLMLMKDLKLKIRGSITGKVYVFDGGGSIVDVDKEDAEIMLTKVSGRCAKCSNSASPTSYFSIAR